MAANTPCRCEAAQAEARRIKAGDRAKPLTFVPRVVGTPVALLYFTGQRINEVVRMSWADVRGDLMRVRIQKTRRQIDVAILPELAERLNATPKLAPTILTNANGQPWTQSGLRQKLQDWAKERGHKVVPHGLRKNAVNSLFEAGCTAAEVSGIHRPLDRHDRTLFQVGEPQASWKRRGGQAGRG